MNNSCDESSSEKEAKSDNMTSCCESIGFTSIPRDEDDPRFVLAFSVSSSRELDAAFAFFETYGFVVFKDIYSAEECDRTRSSMWDIIEGENPGFDRNNRDTWKYYASAGKFGLSMRGPCFHPTLVDNRQHPNLIRALEIIIGTTDVMVSHDRFTIYRATQDDASFATGDRNVHLDLNPWWWCESSEDVIQGLNTLMYDDAQDFIKENNLVVRSMGRHVQCVLNFEDNEEIDGGTILVPTFHKHIDDWCSDDNLQVAASKSRHDENMLKEKQDKNKLKKKQKDQRGQSHEQHDMDATSELSYRTKEKCVTESMQIKNSLSLLKPDEPISTEKSIALVPDTGKAVKECHQCSQKQKTYHQKPIEKKQKQKYPPQYSASNKWGSKVKLCHPLPWVIMSDDSELLSLAQRIPLKAGSVLMWDQTMVHGTQPNDGSNRCRMAMFLKAFDRTKCFAGDEGELRRFRRQKALKKHIAEYCTKHSNEKLQNCSLGDFDSSPEYSRISQIGKRVFDI